MPNHAPIILQIIDETGQPIHKDLSVPFCIGMSVKQIMEHAFILAQTSNMPDPFLYTIEYYGYSEVAQFPGYLGYEIESIGTAASMKPNNHLYYWELLINGLPSQAGADTTFPGPGSTVRWEYTTIPSNSAALSPRAKVVHSRR